MPYGIGTQFEMQSAGNTNCWRDQEINNFQDFHQQRLRVDPVLGECRDSSKVAAFQDFIDNFVREQKSLGAERPLNNHLRTRTSGCGSTRRCRTTTACWSACRSCSWRCAC